MSTLLVEILDDLRSQQIDYEEFLKRIADVAKRVQQGKAEDTPIALNTPGKRALFNNLNNDEALALKIDDVVRRVKPDSFRGNLAKERVIKAELFSILDSESEVERIFQIIVNQSEY
jgi:type I restriction enzyme R subunit